MPCLIHVSLVITLIPSLLSHSVLRGDGRCDCCMRIIAQRKIHKFSCRRVTEGHSNIICAVGCDDRIVHVCLRYACALSRVEEHMQPPGPLLLPCRAVKCFDTLATRYALHSKFESLRDRRRPPSFVCSCTNNPTPSNTYTCNHAGLSRPVVINFAIQANPTRQHKLSP